MRAGDDQTLELQPGTLVSGRYEIVKRLGRGSMGFVYACRDREHAGRLVAMKVLFPDFAKDKTGAARFRNEILAAFEVHHENVMSAFEYIRDGTITAYTMEYVGGGDLASRITGGARLPISEVLRLLAQMTAGVSAVHAKGIIHRDLKPENILLTSGGDVKIADFGIARTERGPKLTEHGGVVGTIDYVSPEYMLRGQVDTRSDIYALGILAYEMITGEAPFKADSVYATMTKRLKQDPAPPSQVRSDSPVELDQIVLKAMAREPEDRYQHASEMHADLNALRADLGLIDEGSSRASTGSLSDAQARKSVVVRVQPDAALNDAEQYLDRDTRSDDPLGAYVDTAQPQSSVEPAIMEPLLARPTTTKKPAQGADWSRASNTGSSSRKGPGDNRVALNRMEGPSNATVAGTINPHKLRTLSPSAGIKRHPLWHDIALALIMLFIGIGCSFAVISVLLPKFMDSPSTQSGTSLEEWDVRSQ